MLYCGYRYAERSELKIYTRTIRNSFFLSEAERLVLLFILDRTVGWHKVWEMISLSEFINGVSRRIGGRNRSVVSGTGFTAERVNRAVENLREMRAIETQGEPSRMCYRIDEHWSHPDLMKMWEVSECDYIYGEDA